MITFVKAELLNTQHAQALVTLLNEYALDEMGGDQALSNYTKSNLVNELAKRDFCHVILAYVNDEPAGLALCFEAFSTFNCKPILNIHDFMVSEQFRGQGLAKKLIFAVEQLAVDLGCCKITLEVLEHNSIARNAYHSCGFNSYELNPELGRALFYEKKL